MRAKVMRRKKRSPKARSVVKMAEIAIAAPQVVALRTARMLAAGANPGKDDRAEFSRMGVEKAQVFWESLFAMTAQIVRMNQRYACTAVLQWWRLSTTSLSRLASPFKPPAPTLSQPTGAAARAIGVENKRVLFRLIDAGVTPVHKRVTANTRRLTRAKRK